MAEWSIAAVLKTVEGHTSGGSNPSLSAIKPDYQAFVVYTPNFTPSFGREIGCFVWGLKGEKKGIKMAQAESTVHMLNWAIRSVKFLGVEFD